MAIRQSDLRSAARRPARGITTLQEAKTRGAATVFLSHSHNDAELARGLVTWLNEAGWSVYVDWEDTEMPDKPDRETAARIKQRIQELDFFLFLATENSMRSRWCPWEIGYADGVKQIDRLLVIPTSDNTTTHGNEYLDVYRRIDTDTYGAIGTMRPGRYIRESLPSL